MSGFWQRALIVFAMILLASLAAKMVDRRISRRGLAPEAATRYRILRRAIFAAIVFVGVMSALLVIPQVRALAGGVLASSAVLGLVIGFASQRTIGNVVAGILIAFTQPLRLGDEVEVAGVKGVVEEIGLTYTWIRTRDNDRLVVPNENAGLGYDSQLDDPQPADPRGGDRPGARDGGSPAGARVTEG